MYASWGDAKKLPAVRASIGASHHHHIPFGDFVLDVISEIGKRGVIQGEDLAMSFTSEGPIW